MKDKSDKGAFLPYSYYFRGRGTEGREGRAPFFHIEAKKEAAKSGAPQLSWPRVGERGGEADVLALGG